MPRLLGCLRRECRAAVTWSAFASPLLVFHHHAFHRARLVQNPLKQSADGRFAERAAIGALRAFQHLAFAFGLVERGAIGFFQLADFEHAARPLVEQLHQLTVDLIDFATPMFYVHTPGSRRLIPCRPACLSVRTRAATASHAASERGGLLDLFHQGRAYHGGVGEAAQHRDLPGQRNAESHGDGQRSRVPHAPQQRGQIFWQRILCASDAGAGDDVEEPAGTFSDARQALAG